MITDSDHTVDDLLCWCSAHGIRIDERIRVGRGEDGAIAMYAGDAFIDCGTTLVTIPKTSILSIRNCLLSEHIVPVTYGMEAQLGLALALYGELLRGPSSPWFGYLQSLPKCVNIALFWDGANEDEKGALGWIRGTMAQRELLISDSGNAQTTMEDAKRTAVDGIRQYYDLTAATTLVKANFEEHATRDGFKHAYALVSSRAFLVDAYHGLAMVPIADAFNHRSENHVHLESDFDVCFTCGALAECPHDAEVPDDAGAGDPVLRDGQSLSGDDQTSKELEDTCEMVTNAPVPPFAEVFNTYGELLTNAQLLVRYGFLLDSNENDIISWDLQELCNFVPFFVGADLLSSGNDGDKRCDDNATTSIDHDLGNFGKTSCDLEERLKGKASRALEHEDQDRESGGDKDIEVQDGAFSSGQVLLERLREVLDLWNRGGVAWTNSTLVYDPNDQDRQEGVGLYDSSGEEGVRMPQHDHHGIDPSSSMVERGSAHFRSGENTPKHPRRRKQIQTSFSLNDDAKMSHHLWLFCALLALHENRLRRRVTDSTSSATRTSEANVVSISSEQSISWSLPSRDISETNRNVREIATRAPQGRRQDSYARARSRENDCYRRLLTSPEADVSLLQRIARVQCMLEGTSADTEIGDAGKGEEDEETFEDVEADSVKMDAGYTKSSGTRVNAKEAWTEVEAEEAAPTSQSYRTGQGRNAHGDGSRKRARMSSASWSARTGDGGGKRKSEDDDKDKASKEQWRVMSRRGWDQSEPDHDSSQAREQRLPEEEGHDWRRNEGELGRVVGSIGRVVSGLCGARVRGMAYPGLDAAELGELIDAIPQMHGQMRMAAQLALGERALLESWAAAWSEISRI